AELDHLAHRLVAHDVARQHSRDEAVHQVQVRAADAGRGDPDDGVLGVLDDRLRHLLAAEVLLALPADRFHRRAAPWSQLRFTPVSRTAASRSRAVTPSTTARPSRAAPLLGFERRVRPRSRAMSNTSPATRAQSAPARVGSENSA